MPKQIFLVFLIKSEQLPFETKESKKNMETIPQIP